MRAIGVLTSGGDAPGMNAAIRAVTRTGIDKGLDVFGVDDGYRGLAQGKYRQLGRRDVGSILNKAGSMLYCSRYPEFKEKAVRESAIEKLRARGIDGLIVIGGNGSQAGAFALGEMGFPCIGIPSTIDNDVVGTGVSIGVDTAVNVALESIDRLRATALSHHRGIVVEVMGRDSGHLALQVGITGGAEVIVVPEIEADAESIAAEIQNIYHRGKSHALIIVSEGAKYNAEGLLSYFQEHDSELVFPLRGTVLGYVQRGGAPTNFDRMLGSRLGSVATELLSEGKWGLLVGTSMAATSPDLITTPLKDVVGTKRPLDEDLLQLARILAQ